MLYIVSPYLVTYFMYISMYVNLDLPFIPPYLPLGNYKIVFYIFNSFFFVNKFICTWIFRFHI